MVSGPAPGRLADTSTVGKSTLGNSAMGRKPCATTPKSTMAVMISVVMTGRRMQSSGKFMASQPFCGCGLLVFCRCGSHQVCP